MQITRKRARLGCMIWRDKGNKTACFPANSGEIKPVDPDPEPEPSEPEPSCDDCHFPTLTYSGEEIDSVTDGYQDAFIGNFNTVPYQYEADPWKVEVDFAGLYIETHLAGLGEKDSEIIPTGYWHTDRWYEDTKTVIVRFYIPHFYPWDICEMNTVNCGMPGQNLKLYAKWGSVLKPIEKQMTYIVYSQAFDSVWHPWSPSIILGKRAATYDSYVPPDKPYIVP